MYRFWVSVRMGHLEEWFRARVSDSVYSAGGGRRSIEAWNSTAVDVEEVFSDVADGDLRIFVADVVKSFDTVGPLGFCTLIFNIMLGLG